MTAKPAWLAGDLVLSLCACTLFEIQGSLVSILSLQAKNVELSCTLLPLGRDVNVCTTRRFSRVLNFTQFYISVSVVE